MSALTHLHSTLTSASFDPADSVCEQRGWHVYLDDTLNLWEVFIDADHQRSFVSTDTWEIFDGPAEVAFTDTYVEGWRGQSGQVLRVIDTDGTSAFGKAARRALALQGVQVVASKDRLATAVERAQQLAVEAAGINSARSAYQRQIFAARHAELNEDLCRLEAELAQARSAVQLAACALRDPAAVA